MFKATGFTPTKTSTTYRGEDTEAADALLRNLQGEGEGEVVPEESEEVAEEAYDINSTIAATGVIHAFPYYGTDQYELIEPKEWCPKTKTDGAVDGDGTAVA